MRSRLFYLTTVVGAFAVLHSCKEDPQPETPVTIGFEIATLTVAEGATGTALKVTVPTAPSTDRTFKAKIGGSAMYGFDKDFTTTPAPDNNGDISVTVLAGSTSVTVAQLTVNHDGLIESTEEVTLSLTSLGEGVEAGVTSTMKVTIVDDPTISFEGGDLTVKEGDEITVNVTTTVPLAIGQSISVNYAVSGGLVVGTGQDLTITPTPVSANISLSGNTTTLPIKLATNADTKPELAQTVTLELAAVSGINLGSKKTIVISITNNSLSDGIVAEYVFDGNANDTSGKGNHGTVSGATLTSGKTGVNNTAYSFNGASRIVAPASTHINFARTAEFSVSVWASASDVQNDMSGTINDIIRAWTGDHQGYPFGVSYYNSSAPNPKTFVGARYDGSGCANIPQAISGGVNSNFHHIVFIRKGTSLSLYVDNVLAISTNDFTACSTQNDTPLYIGCRGQNLRCFTGKIDDVRVYNRALAAVEIADLFKM